MQEDRFSYLEQVEHETKEEGIVDDPAEAALDRFVALLNWTLLSVSSNHRSSIIIPSLSDHS